jgi:hypothetical protein
MPEDSVILSGQIASGSIPDWQIYVPKLFILIEPKFFLRFRTR